MTNPSVIIEILPPDTYELWPWKNLCCTANSYTEKVNLSFFNRGAGRKYIRNATESWTLTKNRLLSDVIFIETIGYQTTLAGIYRDVMFEEKENDGRGTVIKRR